MFLEVFYIAAFILYVLLAAYITKYVALPFHSKIVKIIVRSLSVIVFILILIADSLVGNLRLDNLCESEGGTHIYETVELGSKYWHEDGSPKFIYPIGHRNYGTLNQDLLKYRYEEVAANKNYLESPRIKMRTVQIIEKESQKILGEHKMFVFSGGWVNRFTSIAPSGRACKIDPNQYINLYLKIFIRG
ncbi:MAG: hypothetical protein OER98_07410 [Gammaproteobacteria bacterium]|nr:hypothetical protein [Gammaproteobacteria bacterium]